MATNRYDYRPVLDRILKMCEKYSAVFEGQEKPLVLFQTLPEPDESAEIGIKKDGERISYYFGGSYLSYHQPLEPTIDNVICALEKIRYIGSPRDIAKVFAKGFGRFLGEYLAKQESERIETLLLN